MKNTPKLVTILVALSVTSVVAADWPWLYGPRRDHTSEQKGLLRTWPQEGPKVLWTVPMGAGFGGPPSAAGTCICWTATRRSGDTLRVLDLASGKELWTFAYDAPAASCSPAHARRRPWTASTSTPSGRWGICTPSARRPQARLAQEHLEGLRRRRPAAAVGDRPESVDLR